MTYYFTTSPLQIGILREGCTLANPERSARTFKAAQRMLIKELRREIRSLRYQIADKRDDIKRVKERVAADC